MKKLTLLSTVSFLLYGMSSFAQVTTTTNASPAVGTPFLGWDGTGVGGPRDLEIRNNFNQPISMFTGGAQRIWINEFKSPTINGHPFARNGYVGIGSNAFNIFSNPALGPFSLLHLNGGNGGFQTAGHHHWMKTGITLTDNSDLI